MTHAGEVWDPNVGDYVPLPECAVSWCERRARTIVDVDGTRFTVCDRHARHLTR